MLTKITKRASWAITIAILQHLILTTLATPVSVNGFNSIEKRLEGANLEERYVDNRKFAYNAGDPTGQGPAKRSPVFIGIGSLERSPQAYVSNHCKPDEYCRRSVQSVRELLASLKKRAPISWGTGAHAGVAYLFGQQCGKSGCHKSRSFSSISETANSLEERAPTQLQKRSQIPSNIEDPMENGSLRRTIDDLSDEMTFVLFRKHFVPPNFANMFRFWPGTTKRELFGSNEGMANVMVKRVSWLEWFRGHWARTKRQELASDENETQMLTRRWAPYCWWCRYMAANQNTRKRGFFSDENETQMPTRRWTPYCWWCRYMAAGEGTRKRRFFSDGFSNDERRSDLNENLMLFNERWNGVMESYDETLEQAKRSSILELFLMYWTMPTRRSFKDRIQLTKREPTWANWLSYRPGTHRRSSEEEEERETQYTTDQFQLVKRSPIFRYSKFFWGAPPRRSIEGLETNAKNEIVFDKRDEHKDEKEKERELSFSSTSVAKSNLIKREPIFHINRYPSGPIRRSLNEESMENNQKREPAFAKSSYYNFGHKRSLSEEETTSEVEIRDPAYRKYKMFTFDPRNLAAENDESGAKVIEREVFDKQESKKEQVSKRSPIFSWKGNAYLGPSKNPTKRDDANDLYQRSLEEKAFSSPDAEKRSPIFSWKGKGYLGTQTKTRTKRDDANGLYQRSLEEKAFLSPDTEKRSPVFRPTTRGGGVNNIYKSMEVATSKNDEGKNDEDKKDEDKKDEDKNDKSKPQ